MAQSNPATPVKKHSDAELEDFEGFVHSVSPPKKSKRNHTPYFNMVLQTDRNDFHNAVFFTYNAENVRNQLLKASEKKKPIKLKKATKSISFSNPSSFDITCNATTGILPLEEIKFAHKNPPITPTMTIENVKLASIQEIVSVDAKVSKLFPPQEKTSKDGKPLTLHQCHISDATGSIEVSLWAPSQIFKLDQSYSFQDVSVKEFNGIKSLTYMQTSSHKIIADLKNVSTNKPDSSSSHAIKDEISSVNSTIVFKCCSCSHELVPTTSKFIKCSACHMKQKTSNLRKSTSTKLKLSKSFVKYTLTNQALSDFLLMSNVDITNMDSDDIEEFLLNIDEALMFTIINNNVIEKIEKPIAKQHVE
ncbi:hypothetical protein LOTGIDRAFT_175573 [Lottia gigantea]|uniref:Uncharacterized protein n=1 Tax=Lottia gigantea TaxID=225164 RepID=V3ZPV9_LOTGI|nr:hypothetical protein LOTGIDRAFT_175573 [Lottia gigantea]ESO93418.1 hypothetical protein LOTGIDRAFT_175573 [Lottia gigantea]